MSSYIKVPALSSIILYLSMIGIVCACSAREATIEEKSKADTQNVIKVGVLFSLTGSMALSEVSMHDAVLMAIEEINNDGGLLGKKIEPVVLDPHSDIKSYQVLTSQLYSKHQVTAVFGCSSTEARKQLLPVVKKNNGLLFYPGPELEGESAENIVYLGATPAQQLIPAIDYLLTYPQKAFDKYFLLGTDNTYSHNANSKMRAYLTRQGISSNRIVERYAALDQKDFEAVVSAIKMFSISGKACVINTMTGGSNLSFYKEFTNQGLSSATCPIMSLSAAEDEFRQMNTEFFTGHLCTKNYFQSVDSDKNIRFASSFKLYCAIHELPQGVDRVTSDAICWAYTGVMLWRKAVEKAGSFDHEKVKQALYGMEYNSPAGLVQLNSHKLYLSKPVFIGENLHDGQYDIVWNSDSLVSPFEQIAVFHNTNNIR